MPVMEQTPVSTASRSVAATRPSSVKARSHTAIKNSATNNRSVEDKVCWIEMKRYPYQPDQQVELLHLQAEADALLIKLQASEQKKLAKKAVLAEL